MAPPCATCFLVNNEAEALSFVLRFKTTIGHVVF